MLLDQCDNILGRSFCALADGATSPITSSIEYFRDEYLAHLEQAAARSTRPPPPSSPPQERTGMTSPTGSTRTARRRREDRPGHADHRRRRGQRAQGHPGHPGRRADRHPDPAVLRPPAARPGRRLPAVPGRGPDAGNGRGMPKPQASCTIAVCRRHGGEDPAHLAGRRQGPAGRHGVPADQPPARLPGLRQGRRVPAAEPGDVQRPRRVPVPETKRTFPKPINISAQVLLDRERCVLCARCTRFSEQIAGDPFIALIERGALQQVGIYEQRAVRVLLLRQHDPDLPGRRADLGGVPLPLPAVRPGLHAVGVRALRRRGCALRTDHRRGKVTAPAGRRRPRGQRGVELRQGPLRVPLRPPARPAHHARWSATTRPASCAPASWPEAFDVAARGLAAAARQGRRADRRPAHRRGRLRVRASSPASRSAPTTSTSAPARTRPRRPTSSPRTSSGTRPRGRPTPTSRRRRAVLLVGLRARGRVADRLPAAAQGGPQARHQVVLDRPVHHARPAQDARHAGPRPPRATRPPRSEALAARPATSAARRRRRASWSASGSRPCPGALSAAAALADDHRRPAGLGPAPRRGARRARGRLPAGPAARRPPGRRRRRPRRPRHRLGRRPCRTTPAATPTRSSRPPPPASSTRWSSAASTRRPARPGARAAPRSRPPASWSASRSAPARSPSAPTWSSRSPRSPRRPACSSTGRAGSARSTRCCASRSALPDLRVLAGIADEMGVRPRLPHRRARPAPRCRSSAPGTATRAAFAPDLSGARVAGPRRPPATVEARAGDAGSCCSTTGRMLDGDDYLKATARTPVALVSRGDAAARSASPPASTSRSTGDRGTSTLPVGVADLPDGVVWAPTNSGLGAAAVRRRDLAARTGRSARHERTARGTGRMRDGLGRRQGHPEGLRPRPLVGRGSSRPC